MVGIVGDVVCSLAIVILLPAPNPASAISRGKQFSVRPLAGSWWTNGFCPNSMHMATTKATTRFKNTT